MSKAIAIANNDVAFLAWSFEAPIPNCLGFSIHRKDLHTGQTTVLPAWVGFQGGTNKNWQPRTTDDWPVQKFNWRDFTTKPRGSYTYEVIPMTGTAGKLTAQLNNSLVTNQVDLTPVCGSILAFFNRGILSTQSVAHMLPLDASGAPSSPDLIKHISTKGDPLRLRLAGEMLDALELLLNRAKAEGGTCYAALYELADQELVARLQDSPFVHLILSNTGPDDATDKHARALLHASHLDITDRMLKSGHIGHNKFVVYLDKHGDPQAVLTGSTNWTSTAICAQSNNALICQDPNTAAAYFAYWQRIKADAAHQAPGYRSKNDQAIDLKAIDATLWFSPNTKQQTKPKAGAATPGDLDDVFQAIAGAKQAILFLLFQPGSPSVIDAITQAANANGDLFVRGAATDPNAVNQFDTSLFHQGASKPDVVKDASMVAATEIRDAFAYWQRELLKASPGAHAIIHDKIVVIDPFGESVVVTGSHNLGFTASYANDENLLIVKGNQPLAAAYATHAMDIYDHYRWRYWLQTQKARAWTGLDVTPAWQDKYFKPQAQKENLFWTRPAMAHV